MSVFLNPPWTSCSLLCVCLYLELILRHRNLEMVWIWGSHWFGSYKVRLEHWSSPVFLIQVKNDIIS